MRASIAGYRSNPLDVSQADHDIEVYVRIQAKAATPSGRHPGVFALANGLAADGRLSAEEHRWWRENNDWYETALTDPGKVAPPVFDRAVHPHTRCWFKVTASHLLARLPGYLRLLDAHGVEWVELRSADPGAIIYEDDDQVVVAVANGP